MTNPDLIEAALAEAWPCRRFINTGTLNCLTSTMGGEERCSACRNRALAREKLLPLVLAPLSHCSDVVMDSPTSGRESGDIIARHDAAMRVIAFARAHARVQR